MEHRAPSRSLAVSNSSFSDLDAPSETTESFPRSPLRKPAKIIHVDVDDIGGEKPTRKRSIQWSGLFNIFLMIGICVAGVALYSKANEANESKKEANALKSELERMKKSQPCDDKRRKLDENRKGIEQLEEKIDRLEKEKYRIDQLEEENGRKIRGLELQIDQHVTDLSLKERQNEDLKNIIQDLEAKLSRKNEKEETPDDSENEDVETHSVFTEMEQEPDEASEKLIQDLKEMLSKLKDSRPSGARERVDEERVRDLRDLRERFRRMGPIDAQSEASTRFPDSQTATPFSPDDASRGSFRSFPDLPPGSPVPIFSPQPAQPFQALLEVPIESSDS